MTLKSNFNQIKLFQDQQSSNFYLNEVFLVEPSPEEDSSLSPSSSSSTSTTSSPDFDTTKSSMLTESTDVEKKLLQLLSSNHHDKHNQVIDDVSKPTLVAVIDSKEQADKPDAKSVMMTMTSTEKAAGIKTKIIPKSLKKDNEDIIQASDLTNEVLDDFDKTSTNTTSITNSTSKDSAEADQLDQRAKRSITEGQNQPMMILTGTYRSPILSLLQPAYSRLFSSTTHASTP